ARLELPQSIAAQEITRSLGTDPASCTFLIRGKGSDGSPALLRVSPKSPKQASPVLISHLPASVSPESGIPDASGQRLVFTYADASGAHIAVADSIASRTIL